MIDPGSTVIVVFITVLLQPLYSFFFFFFLLFITATMLMTSHVYTYIHLIPRGMLRALVCRADKNTWQDIYIHIGTWCIYVYDTSSFRVLFYINPKFIFGFIIIHLLSIFIHIYSRSLARNIVIPNSFFFPSVYLVYITKFCCFTFILDYLSI